MSLQHVLKNSSVSGKEPTAAQLANGEIALNYHADGPFLTCKDTNGIVRRIAGVWISATAPSTPTPGEFWLDISTIPAQLKVYKDNTDTWVQTYSVVAASTTASGIVELATNAETITGADALRAVTPAALQAKLSDLVTLADSTRVASSTAVKTAYDLANAALPKVGGVMTGQILGDDSSSPSTPGYAFDGDSNTGLLRTGADALALVTGGVSRLTISDAGSVAIPGDLSVQGTTTTIDTVNLQVKDKNIELGVTATPSDITADGGGITLRGTTNKTFNWIDATDSWTSSENIELASGKSLRINGVSVLSQDSLTTGTAIHALGSASTPSISFTGDLNTGLYSPGADQVAISTGGSGRLFIDASGRVGAGTSAPQGSLHVHDSVSTISRIRLTNSTTTDATGKGLLIAQNGLDLNITNNEAGFTAFATSGSERLRITSAGLVGVGTSSPGFALDVVPPASAVVAARFRGNFSTTNNTQIRFYGANAATDQWAIGNAIATDDATRNFDIFDIVSNANRFRITSDGKVGIGTTSPPLKLSIDGDLWFGNGSGIETGRLFNDAGVLHLRASSNVTGLALGTNGTEKLRITSAGNVGIGTSSPDGRLEINDQSNGAETFPLWVSNQGAGVGTRATIRFDVANSYYGSIGGGEESGGGSSVVIDAPSAGGIIRFTKNNKATEIARFDSLGRLGIGTSSPNAQLEVKQPNAAKSYSSSVLDFSAIHINGNWSATTSSALTFSSGGGGGAAVAFSRDISYGTYLSFWTNNQATANTATERLRIDSDGRVLVGTSSSRFYTSLGDLKLQVEGTSWPNSSIGATNNQATVDGAYIALAKTRGTSVGSLTSVQSGDLLGSIWFQGADGTALVRGATINCIVDGNPSISDMPGALSFATTADGASFPTERMRINSSGTMLQGNTADTTGVLGTGLKVKSNAVGSSFSAAALCLQGTGGDFYAVKFADQDMGILSVTSGATDAIQIGGSATTATLFSNGLVQLPNVGTTASAANVFMDSAAGNQLARSTSSLRYKTDIEDLDTDRADAALSLRPVWYRSKATADRKDWSHYGLIAEEVAEIEPRLVNWTYLEDDYITVTNEYGIENKELKPDAELVPDGVQYDRLPVLLLNVVQRQEKRIKQLEAEIAALKAQ